MNSSMRCAATLLLLASASMLSACGAGTSSQQQTFRYSGSALAVVSDAANMPVSIVRDGAAPRREEVTASVTTHTVGKRTETPAWSLTGSTLTLGSPCGGGWVGYCEGSFTVTVPQGVAVSVNGRPAAVG